MQSQLSYASHTAYYYTFVTSYLHSCTTNPVLQLGFEGRGVPGRAHSAQSYKNEGTRTHVMCLES